MSAPCRVKSVPVFNIDPVVSVYISDYFHFDSVVYEYVVCRVRFIWDAGGFCFESVDVAGGDIARVPGSARALWNFDNLIEQ